MRAIKDSYDILLIEDDLGDLGLVKIAMRKGSHPINLHHVVDGDEALGFLRRVGAAHSSAPRPDLVLLDLNLPGRSGHEILEDLKTDRSLRMLPVVVLTTSEAERDVNKAYGLGANSVVTKPMDMEAFTQSIHSILDYWLGIVRLPPRP